MNIDRIVVRPIEMYQGKILVSFSVEDSGCGLSEDLYEKVFQPFFQDDQAKVKTVGTGLGLAICKKIAEMMGGTIEVTGRLGHGCQFTATLSFNNYDDKSQLSPQGLDGIVMGVISKNKETRDVINRYFKVFQIGCFAYSNFPSKSDLERDAVNAFILDGSTFKQGDLKSFIEQNNSCLIRTPLILSSYEVEASPELQVYSKWVHFPLRQKSVFNGLYSQENRGSIPTISRQKKQTTRGAHILVVDDCDLNLKVAARVIESLDHVCTCVGGGKEAIESLKSKTFDLVLLDIQMPGMDGYETTEAIRKMEGGNPTLSPPIGRIEI